MTPAMAQRETKNYCLIPIPTLRQARKFCSGQWVNLIEPLTSLCFEEALLLCEESQDKWVAWVPGFGEKRLDISEFA